MEYLPHISSSDSEGFENNLMSVSEHSPTASVQESITPPLFPLSGISATSEQQPPEHDTIPLNPPFKELILADPSGSKLSSQQGAIENPFSFSIVNPSQQNLFFHPRKLPCRAQLFSGPGQTAEQATPAASMSTRQQAATPASETQQEHSPIFNEINAFMQPFADTLSSVSYRQFRFYTNPGPYSRASGLQPCICNRIRFRRLNQCPSLFNIPADSVQQN
ncbi:UNVERIFIED_CONTAM: hypothetical protein FKN15_026411 [Acipenser sinensis]